MNPEISNTANDGHTQAIGSIARTFFGRSWKGLTVVLERSGNGELLLHARGPCGEFSTYPAAQVREEYIEFLFRLACVSNISKGEAS